MSKLALFGGNPIAAIPTYPWPQITADDELNLKRLLEKGKFSDMDTVTAFENRFAAYCKSKHCLAVANGTVSLELILRALGIGYGDEVILPPYTFVATLSSVIFTSATPVFADIDRNTYNISPASVKEKITPKTKAIIAVAVAGRPCDFDELEKIAKEAGVSLVVDAAQAVGAEWKGVSIANYGVAASFSCQNSKNLTCGEGGLITTNNDELYENMCLILSGRKKDGSLLSITQQSRISAFCAAVLDAQMNKLDREIFLRERNAAYLDGLLAHSTLLKPMPHDARITVHAHHLYQGLFNLDAMKESGIGRDKWMDALNAEGVKICGGYSPLYRFKCLTSPETRRLLAADVDTSELPGCKVASDEEGSWLYQSVLLGTFDEMESIAAAVEKVWQYQDELKK